MITQRMRFFLSCLIFLLFTPLYLSASHYSMNDAERKNHDTGTIHYSDVISFLSNTAASRVSDATSTTLSDWINGNGQVGIQLNTYRTLSKWDLNARFLYPVLENSDGLIFFQGGYHHPDGRHQGNIGTGIRLFQDSWMAGFNVFYDHDFSQSHSRFGSGIEYAQDFMSISANTYRRLSDWRDDKYLTDYQSRPANGWDIRSQAWFPAYPQIGGKFVFEQYYGSNVALSSPQKLQNNPYAFTVGADYTPFPLITASLDQKKGRSGSWNTRLGISLNYILGVPWHTQMSTDAVAQLRFLTGSRYNFVNRNDDIVLDYRKAELISLGFPAEVRDTEQTVISFIPVIKSKYPVKTLELDDAELLRFGGEVISASPVSVSIRLPFYRQEPVRLTGVAVDHRGNRSALAITKIYTSRSQHLLILNADKQEARADGKDAVTFVAQTADASGQPSAGKTVHFKTDKGYISPETGITDEQGQIKATLTSEQAGEAHVTVAWGSKVASHSGVRFIAMEHGEIEVDKRTALASGDDKVDVTLSLKDEIGNAVPFRDVNWGTSLGTLSSLRSKTDKNGQSRVELVSKHPGTGIVTASTEHGIWSSETVKFRATNVTVTTSVKQITSSGYDPALYIVTVHNANGSPLPGKTVRWKTSLGVMSELSSVTDSRGQSSMRLTSQDTGIAKVVVNVGEEKYQAPDVTVVEYLRTFLSGEPTASIDGRDAVIMTLTVEDRDRHPLPGESVRWATSHGTLSETVTITDNSGHTFVTLDSAEAGVAQVVADVRGNTQTHSIIFGETG